MRLVEMEYQPMESEGRQSVMTTDLDAFLSGVYRYFSEKGLRPLIFRSVFHLAASVFTFGLSVVVLLLIDWSSVVACTAEDVCRSLNFFYDSPIFPLTWYRFIILCQLVPLGLYTVVLASLSSVAKMREALRISAFFQEALGIRDDDELCFITYEEVVRRICLHQRTAEAPLCIVQDTLSPLEVENIVMRTDNFSVAVWKQWYDFISSQTGLWGLLVQIPLQSTAVQWCVQFAVIGWLFDDRYRLRPEVVADMQIQVKRRIRQVGFLSVLLMFPLAIFSSILVLVKESDDVRTQRSSLFAHQWTGAAVLRHFCEPLHALRDRLEKARTGAELFTKSRMISDGATQAAVMALKYAAGGVVAVLAIVGVVQDGALLHMTYLGKSLFFYFAIFSGIVTVFSGMAAGTNGVMQKDVKSKVGLRLLASVHHVPTTERLEEASVRASRELTTGRCLDRMSGAFGSLFFGPKLTALVTEIAGILLLPVLFLAVFPDHLSRIIADTRIVSSDALGDFVAAGFMSGGVSAGQATEMMAPTTNTHRFAHLKDREKIVSLLSFVGRFGSESGLTDEQTNTVKTLTEFMRECESMMDPSLLGVERNNVQFWYLVLHAVLFEPDTSVVGLCKNVVEMVTEVTAVLHS